MNLRLIKYFYKISLRKQVYKQKGENKCININLATKIQNL